MKLVKRVNSSARLNVMICSNVLDSLIFVYEALNNCVDLNENIPMRNTEIFKFVKNEKFHFLIR